jgi:protein gp37
MILKNNIGWCDVTANPGIGCRGCELGDQCYAKFDTPARVLRAGKWPSRLGQPTETFGPGRAFVPTREGLKKLRALNHKCVCDKCHTTAGIKFLGQDCFYVGPERRGYCDGQFRRIRAFCDSNSDWMDWPIDVLAAALDEIRNAPNVDVILLTKWPWLFEERLEAAGKIAFLADTYKWIRDWWFDKCPPKNVITLTSVLGNGFDEKRLAGILAMPSACRGLSCEPLWAAPNIIGPFDSPQAYPLGRGIQWIIVGCDSSKERKGWEHYEENARKIIERCRDHETSVYHKQMPINGRVSLNPAEWPAWAQVREFYQLGTIARGGVTA